MIREHGHTLDIDLVTHRYGSVTAVADVSLAVRAGEIVALLGPSGCGKTTLLRVVAGFVRQSKGSVRIDGKPVDHLPANLRNVGIVFQSYALFPHMTVADNIAYGLEARGTARAKVRKTVDQFLEVVRLTELRDRLPRQLSGGQQQRVAVARALAVEPTVLLLDEPFSALDKGLRLDMQIEIKRLQRQFGLTAILVTHDQDEAMSVADRIAVMNRGKVEAPGRFRTEGGLAIACAGSQPGRGALSLRPERVKLNPVNGNCANVFSAQVEELIYLGDHTRVRASVCGNHDFVIKVPNSEGVPNLAPGAAITVGWKKEDCRALDAF